MQEVNETRMYYLMTDKEYISSIDHEQGWIERVTVPSKMKLFTEMQILKYYGAGWISGYTICEVELGKKVELKYEFVNLSKEEKSVSKTVVKD